MTAVCRWASTIDVFLVADDVAEAAETLAAVAAATALANAEVVVDAAKSSPPLQTRRKATAGRKRPAEPAGTAVTVGRA